MEESLVWKSLKVVTRILTTVLFDLKTYGRGNVPSRGGALLVANHQSYLDPMLIAVQLRRPVCFLARSSLFTNRYFGWLIRTLHAFPVRQGEGDVGAVKEAIHRLREGHVLNIYPEGSRSETGQIGPMEKGVALVIRRAGVPVVPVAIDGSFQAWPRDRILFRPHPIRVLYGPAMDLSRCSAEEILSRIDAALRGLLSQLRQRRGDPHP